MIMNTNTVLTFDSTPTVGHTNPVTSNGIANAISDAISNVYKIKGSATVSQINGGTITFEVGDVYNMTDSGTITLGNVDVNVGDNIVYIQTGTNPDTYSWDKLSPTIEYPVTDVKAGNSSVVSNRIAELGTVSVKTAEEQQSASGSVITSDDSKVPTSKAVLSAINTLDGQCVKTTGNQSFTGIKSAKGQFTVDNSSSTIHAIWFRDTDESTIGKITNDRTNMAFQSPTGYVALEGVINLSSPSTPLASDDNSNKIATTAWVNTAINNGIGYVGQWAGPVTSNSLGFHLTLSYTRIAPKKGFLKIGLFKPEGTGTSGDFTLFKMSDIIAITGINFKIPSSVRFSLVNNRYIETTNISDGLGFSAVVWNNGYFEIGRIYLNSNNQYTYGSWPSNRGALQGWSTFEMLFEEN